MAEFSVNTHRVDPYKNFRFRVKWDNKYVPGLVRVSPLRRVTAVVEERAGGDVDEPRRSPGTTTWAPIVLERGRTHDTAFEDWANLVFGVGGSMSLAKFRKDVVVELLNEQGTTVMAFRVHRAWPSEYAPLGQLNADGGETLLETLVLEHEGFERDLAVLEPEE